MNWSRVFKIAGTAAAGTAAGCGYCSTDWLQVAGAWQDGAARIEIPVDAAPWLLRPCHQQDVPDECVLIVDGVTVPVEATVEGTCDQDYSDFVAGEFVIQTLRPGQPLPPGATVELDCDHPDAGTYVPQEYVFYGSYGYSGGPPPIPRTLQIRTDPAPTAPPGALTVLELQYTREDPEASCTEGDYIEARVDFDAAFLREGGYILVTYPDGHVLPFARPNDDGIVLLPPTRGILKFTPVAIDGERGETVEVDANRIADDLVYIPGCRQNTSTDAPALLLPVLGLALLRRRRARS